MKTNLEILKENRSLIIAELTNAYSFQKVTIKRLMSDFMIYLEKEGESLFEENRIAQINVIKNVIRYFSQEMSYERNTEAINEFTTQQRDISMKHFN